MPMTPQHRSHPGNATTRALALLLLTLGLAGCPPRDGPDGPHGPDGPVPRPDEAAAAQLLAEARAALGASRQEDGLRLLAETVRRFPDTEAADAARLNLGVAALDAGRPGEAERRLQSLRRRPPADRGAAVAWHRAMARVGAAKKRPGETVPHLDALVAADAAGEAERVELAGLLLERDESARAWEVLREAPQVSGDAVAARRRLREILAEKPDAELEALSRAAPAGEPDGGMLHLLRAKRLLEAGELAGAEAAAKRLDPTALDPPDARSLTELLAELEQRRSVDAQIVGLLLPMTGPFDQVGEQARQAVELARTAVGDDVRLVVLDTKGTPEGAAAAVEALVREHQAIAALGPVGYQEAASAAEAAESYGLPLLPLSSRSDLADGRDWVLRTFASRAAQAQTIARWAVLRYGARRLAILQPESSYGDEVARAFHDEVERLGGEIVTSATYPADEKDLRKALGALLGRRVPPREALRLDDVGFAALLIADTARGVRRVVPYLRFARVPLRTHPARAGILLLGAGAWNHPSIIDPAERLTDNAVFAATFVPSTEDTVVGSFLRSFVARHAVPPTPFQAEVFDTASLLFATRTISGAGDRQRLRAALGAVRNRVGVTGVWTILPDGRVRRTLPVLTIDGELIRPRRSEEEERELRGSGGAPAF